MMYHWSRYLHIIMAICSSFQVKFVAAGVFLYSGWTLEVDDLHFVTFSFVVLSASVSKPAEGVLCAHYLGFRNSLSSLEWD